MMTLGKYVFSTFHIHAHDNIDDGIGKSIILLQVKLMFPCAAFDCKHIEHIHTHITSLDRRSFVIIIFCLPLFTQ